MKLTTREIEVAVVEWLGVRERLTVPNVSWGLNMHECDLLTLNKSGYASEIEIKVSKSDLKADAHKSHLHRSNRIRHLYFAMPKEMECCEEFVPIQAGIVLVWHDADAYGDKPRYRCQLVRRPITNKCARKFTPEEVLDLARLGTLRIWTLKRRVLELEHKIAVQQEADYSI